jgi:hypothetical protein
LKLKGRKASKAVTRRGSAPADPTEVARLTRELDEAREQQTATSEVLQVISLFPGDVQPVFAALLEKAVRICDATCGNIFRYDGDSLHLISAHNTPPAFVYTPRHWQVRPYERSERIHRRQQVIEQMQPLQFDSNSELGAIKRIAIWPEGRENFALSITVAEGTLTVSLRPVTVRRLMRKLGEALQHDQDREIVFDA